MPPQARSGKPLSATGYTWRSTARSAKRSANGGSAPSHSSALAHGSSRSDKARYGLASPSCRVSRFARRAPARAAKVRQWHIDVHVAQEKIGGCPPSRQNLAAAHSGGANASPTRLVWGTRLCDHPRRPRSRTTSGRMGQPEALSPEQPDARAVGGMRNSGAAGSMCTVMAREPPGPTVGKEAFGRCGIRTSRGRPLPCVERVTKAASRLPWRRRSSSSRPKRCVNF